MRFGVKCVIADLVNSRSSYRPRTQQQLCVLMMVEVFRFGLEKVPPDLGHRQISMCCAASGHHRLCVRWTHLFRE